jgi:malate dehydrogenase (oxaloacetate-decarboxylating)(NADP+)
VGGINLEDIKAPECFYIERELQKSRRHPCLPRRPARHGHHFRRRADQRAGNRGQEDRGDQDSLNGAGAASIATADLYLALGAKPENFIMCDSKGVIYKGRTSGMNEFKEKLRRRHRRAHAEDAFVGKDVFIGLSVANCVTREMVRSMAKDPIIFAMANPDPEITYEEVQAARGDVIFGTGRSDYPNQVNNVLGFPFIFRGALDVRARAINMEMKLAATRALAALAKEDVPDSVIRAYGLTELRFGREYIIPKPLDPRVLMWVAPAVAQAAIETGVARRQLDLDAYMDQLAARLGKSAQIMRLLELKARKAPKRIVYGEGEHTKVIRAAYEVATQRHCHPDPAGRRRRASSAQIKNLGLDFNPEIVEPMHARRKRAVCADIL